MVKKVILAVAGSGKTTHIINNLSLNERSLIVTYTNSNLRTLRNGILGKFGFFPENIKLYSYFVFLYSFCYRPFLSLKFKTRGVNFDGNLHWGIKETDSRYYFDSYGRIYGNRISKFLEKQGVIPEVIQRLSKYFENFFIDEIQDIGGRDFDLLKNISQASLNIVGVGDYFQHTFDTSRDGNANVGLHKDYERYKKGFKDMGFEVDTETLKESHRCSPSVCDFVTQKLGIGIHSARKVDTNIQFVEDQEQADSIFNNKSIVKLFYKENYKFGCYSKNWGDCKGENGYDDVCVVLNKTTLEKYKNGELKEWEAISKNKFYVACTRANGNLFFVPENLYKKYKK